MEFYTMIEIRLCKDVDTLADLNRFGHGIHHQKEPGRFKPYDKDAVVQALQNSLAKPTYHSLVAYSEQRPVGYAIAFERIVPENPFRYAYRSLFIDQLVVDPAFRSQGIGARLIQGLEDIAKEKLLDVLELNCWSLNTEAMAFYERMGYRTLSSVMVKELGANPESSI